MKQKLVLFKGSKQVSKKQTTRLVNESVSYLIAKGYKVILLKGDRII
ncbi:MAG: hypothetical protein IAC58_01855 [Firmicutes bacterium]|uniref:Uncharacterized protein n=1 Tax=Candidatus Onthovivens merdipullorum TaxID=2840889 RepID=A0A9D9DLK4_9BACL|nr:hypothetical protein [Candidatus Onthovivens merdipullorum]